MGMTIAEKILAANLAGNRGDAHFLLALRGGGLRAEPDCDHSGECHGKRRSGDVFHRRSKTESHEAMLSH